MTEPLYRSRPGGFQILPASMSAARAIRDGIYVSEGLSNSYLINTSEGRIVVNTGMGFEALVHKRNYDAVNDGPVRYILLTQGHVDHVGGVDLLRQPDTQIVAQANNAAHQADDARIGAFRARRSAFAFSDVIAEASAPLRTLCTARIVCAWTKGRIHHAAFATVAGRPGGRRFSAGRTGSPGSRPAHRHRAL